MNGVAARSVLGADSPTAEEKEPQGTGTYSETMSTYNVPENTWSAKGCGPPDRPADRSGALAAHYSHPNRSHRRGSSQGEKSVESRSPIRPLHCPHQRGYCRDRAAPAHVAVHPEAATRHVARALGSSERVVARSLSRRTEDGLLMLVTDEATSALQPYRLAS